MAQRKSNLTPGIAFVTGGARGLGNAIAVSFASDGARGVVLVDIHAEDSDVVNAGKAAVARANKDTKCIYIRADVTKEDQVESAVQQCVKEFGRLDYAANFAGVLGPLAPSWETNADDWRRVLEVNTVGVWLCVKHEMAQMLKQDFIVAEDGLDEARQRQRGSIVNAASVNSQVRYPPPFPHSIHPALTNSLLLTRLQQAGPGVTGYTASKHAVVGITKSAALEGRSQGIRVNAVSPGFLRTALLEEPLEAQQGFAGEFWLSFEARQGRKATFDEVGDAVVMLSNPRMSLVVGVNLPIDG